MARKRYGEDDILRLIREVEVHCNSGMEVVSACRTAGVSDKTYYGWRRKYGGMNRARLSEMKSLEKENQRLKKIVADLELRNEILNANWFRTTCQAQAKINRWIKEYKNIRPHQSLGMRPPIPETTTLKLDQT